MSKEIGELKNMINFAMWDNALTGTIPTEVGTMYSLQEFFVEKNVSSLCSLASLEFASYLRLPPVILDSALER